MHSFIKKLKYVGHVLYINFILKEIVRFIKACIPLKMRYRQSSKPSILVFANRRGGSTLIGDILCSDKSTRRITEPLDIFNKTSREVKKRMKMLPHPFFSQFITLNNSDKVKVLSYLQNLLKGRYLLLGNYWFSNRSCLKILNAHYLIDDITNKLYTNSIVFIRHPIPQSLSIIRNNWGYSAKAFLADIEFCQKYLQKDQIDYSLNIMTNGDKLEKAVLSWCLENYYPLKYSTCKKTILTYEELIVNSDPILSLLSKEFQIDNKNQMKKRLEKPSPSVHISTNESIDSIRNKDQQKIINNWQTKINQKQQNKIQELFNQLEIDEYNAFDSIPNKKILLFESSLNLF